MKTGAKRSPAATADRVGVPGLALAVDEVLDMRQHHHRVARADAENGDQPDEAAQCQADAAGHDRGHAADQRERHVHQQHQGEQLALESQRQRGNDERMLSAVSDPSRIWPARSASAWPA